jgi:hypothetical protein
MEKISVSPPFQCSPTCFTLICFAPLYGQVVTQAVSLCWSIIFCGHLLFLLVDDSGSVTFKFKMLMQKLNKWNYESVPTKWSLYLSFFVQAPPPHTPHTHTAISNHENEKQSLRENGRLPCVKMFAVRFSSGARQTSTLPCVFRMTHVKQKHTVSIYFAVRF